MHAGPDGHTVASCDGAWSDSLTTIRNTHCNRINGIDIKALRAGLDAVAGDATSATYRFQARNQWLDGGHTRTLVKDYRVAGRRRQSRTRPLVAASDIPSFPGGSDRAIDPLEYVLVGLAASVTASLVWHAALRGIHIDAIDTLVDGDVDTRGCLGLDPDTRPGFHAIRICIGLDAQVEDSELDELAAIAKRLSPVLDTVAQSTRVTFERGPVVPWTAEGEQ